MRLRFLLIRPYPCRDHAITAYRRGYVPRPAHSHTTQAVTPRSTPAVTPRRYAAHTRRLSALSSPSHTLSDPPYADGPHRTEGEVARFGCREVLRGVWVGVSGVRFWVPGLVGAESRT